MSATNRVFKIGIDPGHGGRDPGAIGPYGTREKDIALAISLLIDHYLTQAGVTTYLTRSSDMSLGADARSDLWARTNAINAEKCDYAVSIHLDSLTRTADHFGVYVIQLGGEAERLAHTVINRIQAATGWTWGCDDDGVREKNLHIVRETVMPAILIECNFISNPEREQQLKDPAFQKHLAKAITAGILDYLEIDKEVKEPVEQWKIDIMNQGDTEGIINQKVGNHQPDEPPTKWFVVAVALNLLKIFRKELQALHSELKGGR